MLEVVAEGGDVEGELLHRAERLQRPGPPREVKYHLRASGRWSAYTGQEGGGMRPRPRIRAVIARPGFKFAARVVLVFQVV